MITCWFEGIGNYHHFSARRKRNSSILYYVIILANIWEHWRAVHQWRDISPIYSLAFMLSLCRSRVLFSNFWEKKQKKQTKKQKLTGYLERGKLTEIKSKTDSGKVKTFILPILTIFIAFLVLLLVLFPTELAIRPLLYQRENSHRTLDISCSRETKTDREKTIVFSLSIFN